MTKKERVMKAFAGEEADKVPKGELAVESGLKNKLLAGAGIAASDTSAYASDKAVRELLNMDIAHIHDYPVELLAEEDGGTSIYRGAFGEEFRAASHSTHLLRPALADIRSASSWKVPGPALFEARGVDYFVNDSDFFVSCQIGGPVSSVQWVLGMEDAMIFSMTDVKNIRVLSDKIMEYELFRALSYIDHGADMILIGDDIGINTGLLYPPDILKELAYPLYADVVKEIKRRRNIPVMMHTDGNVTDALDDIVSCGFDGIQSLQPSAGMDIAELKKRYGKDLLLMGNLDLDYLMTYGSPEEISAAVENLIASAAPGGGFILSTCNILIDSIPPENAIAMYEAAEQYGKYPLTEKK